MDFILYLFIFILSGTIALYLKDIKNLLVKRVLQRTDYIIMFIGSALIIFFIYQISESKIHTLIGILGLVVFILSYFRIGITTSGFRSVRGIVKGNFENIEKVSIIKKEYVKIIFLSRGMEDIHYYKLEDYDRILKILKKNLNEKRIEIIYD